MGQGESAASLNYSREPVVEPVVDPYKYSLLPKVHTDDASNATCPSARRPPHLKRNSRPKSQFGSAPCRAARGEEGNEDGCTP